MATSFAYSMVALPNIPGKFWDNVNREHPTTAKFIDKGDKQDGGLNYSPTRMATVDTNGGYYAGTSTSAVVAAAQGNNILNETYNWVYLANAITLLKSDLVVTGTSSLVKIPAMESKKYSAKMRHMQLLADGFMNGDGTSNTPNGMVDLITPTDVFGGVDPAVDSDWTPQTSTSATVLSGPSVVQTMLDNATWLGDSPNLGPTTRALFDRCAAIWGSSLTYIAKDDGEQTLGMKKIYVRGGKAKKNLEIYWDDDMPASNLWLLDEANIKLIQSSVEFMKVQTPDIVNSGLNLYAIKNGGVFSAYIVAAELRRTQGGWTSLS
jgi:hypothetical protein